MRKIAGSLFLTAYAFAFFLLVLTNVSDAQTRQTSCNLSGTWRSSLGVVTLKFRALEESSRHIVRAPLTEASPEPEVAPQQPEGVIVGTLDGRDGLGQLEGMLIDSKLSLRFMKPPSFANGDVGNIEARVSPNCSELRGTLTPTGQADQPWVARRVTVTPRSTDPQYRSDVAALEDALTGLEAAKEDLDRRTFDVPTFAKGAGPDLDAIFATVRDYVAPGLYRGVLRGARGTLMSREGSSADTALLLTEVLQLRGYQVRFARAKLDDAVAEQVVAAALDGPRISASPLPLDHTVPDLANAEASVLPQDESAHDDMYESLVAGAHADGKVVAGALARLVKDAGALEQLNREARRKDWLERVRNHVWVQVNNHGEWIDLDPTFPEAAVGTRLSDPDGTSATLPDELFHRVEFKVEIERGLGSNLEKQIVGAWQARTADVAGAGVPVFSVSLSPSTGIEKDQTIDLSQRRDWFGEAIQDSLSRAIEYTPVLSLSTGEVQTGASFDLAGNLLPADTQARLAQRVASSVGETFEFGAGKIGNLLGGQSAGSTSPDALTAAWIETTILAPDGNEIRSRRTLFDRIGPANRAAGSTNVRTGGYSDDMVREALAVVYDFWVLPSPVDLGLLTEQTADAFLSNAPLLRKATDARYGGEALSTADFQVTRRFAAELAILYATKDGLLERVSDNHDLRAVQVNAHLIGLRTGPRRDDTTISLSSMFDVLEASYEVLDRPDGSVSSQQALAFALEYGAALTVLEGRLMDTIVRGSCEQCDPPVTNAGLATIQAMRKDPSVPLILISNPEALAATVKDPGEIELGTDLLSRGKWIVPAPDSGPRGQTTWWRFDPMRGSLLGILPTGEGAAISEYAVKAAAWLGPTLAGMFGGYMGWSGCIGERDLFKIDEVSNTKAFWCVCCAAFSAIGVYIPFNQLAASKLKDSAARAGQKMSVAAGASRKAEERLAKYMPSGTASASPAEAMRLAKESADAARTQVEQTQLAVRVAHAENSAANATLAKMKQLADKATSDAADALSNLNRVSAYADHPDVAVKSIYRIASAEKALAESRKDRALWSLRLAERAAAKVARDLSELEAARRTAQRALLHAENSQVQVHTAAAAVKVADDRWKDAKALEARAISSRDGLADSKLSSKIELLGAAVLGGVAGVVCWHGSVIKN